MRASFCHQPEGTAGGTHHTAQQDAKWRESQTVFMTQLSSSHFLFMDFSDVSHLISILFAHSLN